MSTEEASYSNFVGSIKSEYTVKAYNVVLSKFKDFAGVETYTQLLQLGDPAGDSIKETQMVIQRFIMAEKKRGIRANSLKMYLSALWHFYQYNDVIGFNWVKLRAFVGEHQRVIKDRGYTVEETRKAFDHADLRLRLVILLMASSGVRTGALPTIKVRNLKRLDGIYRIVVYENTESEYYTFCTPECAAAIDEYLTYRKRMGETIKPDAPLIREQIADPEHPRHVTRADLAAMMKRLMERAGVREHRTGSRLVRHQVMLNHGFRKFYNTQMIKAGVKPVIKEMLIGHKAIGLEGSYFRPTEEEMLGEYLKAVDWLTISTEKKLRMENEELSKKLVGEERMNAKFAELNAKFDAVYGKK